jgi:hypothetical protein
MFVSYPNFININQKNKLDYVSPSDIILILGQGHINQWDWQLLMQIYIRDAEISKIQSNWVLYYIRRLTHYARNARIVQDWKICSYNLS